jgi:hypothetical protein
MKLHRLLVVCLGLSLAACFNFEAAYCDGGYCDAGIGGGAAGGGGAETGGGGGAATGGGGAATGGGGQASGGGGQTGGGGGETDAGLDAGTEDAGTPDAGCGGAVQLAFISPARSVVANTCSAALTLQLQDACGAPVIAAADVPLTLTRSSGTMQLYSEGTCSTMPFNWSVPAGASQLDLNVTDPVPGMPTLTATAAGLDGGSQIVTVTCAAGQLACPNGCVPNSGCCDDTQCTTGGLSWVCDTTSHQCEPPPCTGFPAGCSSWDDRTASGASRTITFDSSGYAPKCMRVSTYQDVTFSGSFFLHPLQQVCGPSNSNLTTTSGTSKTARFPSFGTYGYRCANHPAFEQGAIRVP